MRRPYRRGLVSLLLLLAFAAGPALAARPAAPLPDDMALGNAKAKVTVVEYASASCPHCARFNNSVFPDFRRKYVASGKVRYVFREFLTQPVEVAAAGFLLARCAGKDRYFAVLDDFFHQQDQIYSTGQLLPVIQAVGAKAGLSKPQIDACLSDEAAINALNARVQRYQQQDGVHGTPTFVINGQTLPESDHEVNLADLDAALAPLLKPARGR